MTTIKQAKYPQRVRNELRFRELTVLRVERIGQAFQRIVLGGEALDGFVSQGFDDHTKLFFPQAGSVFTPPEVTDEGINWGEGVRPARWWCRKITPGSFMSVTSRECRRCAAACWDCASCR